MTMTPNPRDGELLSAYLSGDLGDREAAALETRLAEEPELAARLEATRAVVEGLTRLDEVELPDGFSDRLHARLAEERTLTVAEGPLSLAEARARRTERLRPRWPAQTAAPAGVVGLAVLGAAAVIGLRTGDVADLTLEPAADEPGLEAETLEAPDEDTAEAPEEEAVPEDDRTALAEPVLLDTQAEIVDASAARDHFAGSPAATLLGLPVEEAEDVAAGFRVAVQRAEPFGSGAEPGACVEAVAAGAEQPVVPAHVEAVRYEGEDALAYVTATARSGATALDRLEAWVGEPDGCGTRLYVELTP
jgi:hypothetical protein